MSWLKIDDNSYININTVPRIDHSKQRMRKLDAPPLDPEIEEPECYYEHVNTYIIRAYTWINERDNPVAYLKLTEILQS